MPRAAISGPGALVPDLAERLGCGIVKPAQIGALQTSEQRVHGPWIPELAERLCGRHPDIFVGILQGHDQARHGTVVPDVAEDVDNEFSHIGIRVAQHRQKSIDRPCPDMHQRLDGRVSRTGIIMERQGLYQLGNDGVAADVHQRFHRSLAHPPIRITQGAKEQRHCPGP
jgi:hypothetical protein